MITDSINILLPSIIGLSGVIIGSIIAWLLPVINTRRQRKTDIEYDISSSTAICLGRLLKMQTARKYSNQKIFQDEKYHLGADSDNFLRAISNRPMLDESDLSLYLRISEILIETIPEEELDYHVENLITDLRTNVLDNS